jgi:putative ABC transport system permease protein
VPFLAAVYPIVSGVRVTVLEAINDYGVAGSSPSGFVSRLLERTRGLPRPVLLSLRNTFRRKGRMSLTLMALTLSGAVFISAYNIRASLLLTLDGIFAYRNYDVIFFFEQPYRTAKTERALTNLPGVTRVESFHRTADAYRLKDGPRKGNNYNLMALQPENTAFRPPLIKGRWLQPEDRAAMVINDALLRDEPDIRLGDTVLFEIEDREVWLQVVGVVEEARSQPSLYLNYAYFARTWGHIGRANAAWVEIARPEQSADMIKGMEVQFERADLRVARIISAADEKRFFQEHFGFITGFMTLAAILLAVVGALGLMGTMSINVIERVREIGVMRTIGASNGAIQRIFVIEGVVIGFISWLLSLIAGLIPTKLLGDAVGLAFMETPLDYTLSLNGMLVWLAIVVGVSALSTLIPAENASQIKVSELLAYE